jgi:hypothetical protein
VLTKEKNGYSVVTWSLQFLFIIVICEKQMGTSLTANEYAICIPESFVFTSYPTPQLQVYEMSQGKRCKLSNLRCCPEREIEPIF